MLEEKLKQQRVKHIVSSYQLQGSELEPFDHYLDKLLRKYPSPLVELAIVETLVENWLKVPMSRGCAFLTQVHTRLCTWENSEIDSDGSRTGRFISTVLPEQFQQITGLDPTPIFGPSNDQPPSRLSVR